MRCCLLLVLELLLSVCVVSPGLAQQTTTPRVQLSGYVRDAESREVVRYAVVDTDGDSVRTRSNTDGFYFLSLTPGSHRLRVRAIVYAPLDTVVSLTESRTWDVSLTPRPVALQQVQVAVEQEQRDVDPRSTEMSIARLDLATVKHTPSALGEVDPLRSITLLPG